LNSSIFKIFLLLALVISTHLMMAQTSRIVFSNIDETKFNVSINNIKQHQGFTTNIQLLHLKGEMPYNVKIDFENDSTIIKQNIYIIDEGLTHIYTVSKKKLQLKKIIPSASQTQKIENQLVVAYTENPLVVIAPTKIDTAIKDTAYVIPFETYYKMDDYKGKLGCPWPIKDAELTKLTAAIRSRNLEDSKLEIAKEKLLDIDSACFTVDQTRELIRLFEYEETKLEFAKHIALSIFDIDNVGKLEDVFDFENSIEELKTVISNK
jgi:Domain of unknown function (DUF4476)